MPLTQDYTFEIVPQRRGQRAGPTIVVSANHEPLESTERLSVTSLTVAYGENGEGKTTLLLDICRTLSPRPHGRPLGIIWRNKLGHILIDPGMGPGTPRLKGPMVGNEATKFPGEFGSVFYTTSPFEASRRTQLAWHGVNDVTPEFGANAFNGTSLCRAAHRLPADIPFIRQARVSLEFRDEFDLSEQIRMFVAGLFQDDDRGHRAKDGGARYIQELEELAEWVGSDARKSLSVILYLARLSGEKQSISIWEELKRLNETRSQADAWEFFERRNRARGQKFTSSQLLEALAVLRETVRKSSDKLLAYAKALREFPPSLLPMLHEAEELGLLVWNFVDLSSGQVALLMLFSSLSGALESLRNRQVFSAVLVIDEGEMFMHPAWQRKYLHDLTDFIAHYRRDFAQIHLVLATHSLIVAGDAPPCRLFDVKSKKMRNGFAFGPKEILVDIYGVEEFSGDMSDALYAKIVEFFRSAKPTAKSEQEARRLVEHIASPQLRQYLSEEFQRKRCRRNA